MATHRSFTSLSIALETTAEEIETNAARIMREAAGSVHEVVVERTPVDTGRAISNWIISIGSRAGHTRTPLVPGRKGSTAFENRAWAVDRGRRKLSLFDDPMRRIVISNNLDYIQKLNSGSSRQAPAGFVEAGVVAGVTSIRGARLLRR